MPGMHYCTPGIVFPIQPVVKGCSRAGYSRAAPIKRSRKRNMLMKSR